MEEIVYSVVIPLKDEEETIAALIDEVHQAMAPLGKPWELICIDDGSSDATRSILRRLLPLRPYLRLLALDSNHGQSTAFDAGFRAARGCYVITLDGDGQNDPKEIPRLLEAAQASGEGGVDLVCGYRLQRRDSFFKRLLSRLANGVRSRVCGDGIRDTGCSLKVYRREALAKIKLFDGMHRFLPALFLAEGFSVIELVVSHRERMGGRTKYTLWNRSFNTFFDMLAVRWMGRRALRYSVCEERADGRGAG